MECLTKKSIYCKKNLEEKKCIMRNSFWKKAFRQVFEV